jgi:hypothetical protein
LKATQKYDYCSRNLHLEPERYRFSKTGDSLYLKNFLGLRSKRTEEIRKIIQTSCPIDRLQEQYPAFSTLCQSEADLAKWLSLGSLSCENESMPEEFPPNCREFRTKDMISLIICQLLERLPGEPKDRLDMLIKKYEVFRRIQSAYDENFTKVREDANNMALYAFFSLGLLLCYKKKGSLKSLNTALKVNDMLLTQPFRSESAETLILFCAAFEWESSLILELSKKHGLDP